MTHRVAATLAVALLLHSAGGMAAVYKCQKDGKVSYQDKPCLSQFPVAPSAPAAEAPEAPPEAAPALVPTSAPPPAAASANAAPGAADACVGFNEATLAGDKAKMSALADAATRKMIAEMPDAGMGLIRMMTPKTFAVTGTTANGNAATVSLLGNGKTPGSCEMTLEGSNWKVGKVNWGSGKGAKSAARPSSNALKGSLLGVALNKPVVTYDDFMGTLHIYQGDQFNPDLKMTIFTFHTDIKGVPSGRLLEVRADRGMHDPAAHAHISKRGAQKQVFMEKIDLRVQYGQANGKQLPGTISLKLPEGSTVEGDFVADID